MNGISVTPSESPGLAAIDGRLHLGIEVDIDLAELSKKNPCVVQFTLARVAELLIAAGRIGGHLKVADVSPGGSKE